MSPGHVAPDLRTRLLVAGVAAMAIAAALGLVVRDRWSPLDTWAVAELRLPVDARAVEAVAGVGVLLALAGLLPPLAAALRRSDARAQLWRAAVLLAACAAVAGTQALFQRPGPPGAGQDWTYPSGHAVVVTAVAVTAVALCRRAAPTWARAVLVAEALAVAVTTASRVVVGEHFPTDVLGALVGVVGVGLVVTALLGTRERPADPV